MDKTVEKKRRNLQRAWKGAAAGAVAVASLAVGSLFDSPQEILGVENGGEPEGEDVAIVSVGKRAGMEAPGGGRSGAEGIRRFFRGQPAALRAVCLLPLWALGKAGTTLLSLLFSALSPLWQGLLAVLLNGALLLGVFLLLYRVLFPHRPLKQFFRKKTLAPLALCALVLGLTDTMLRLYWPEYAAVSILIKIGLGFLALTLLCLLLFGTKQRKYQSM